MTLAFLLPVSIAIEFPMAPLDDWFDPGGCTTALVSGNATANGRPLLWKNRDSDSPDQEIRYFNDGTYPYVTITSAGENSQAWGGLNSIGFAIVNAYNWNAEDTIGLPDDTGPILKLALRTCRVVNDFQAILDSTGLAGNRTPQIVGVIDSSGGGAMFETFTHSYVRYDVSDPDDAPLGILVRSNFSYAGDPGGRIGVYRHNRAKALLENAAGADSLTVPFVLREVMRDLQTSESFNPYPLPFEQTQGELPPGWISTSGAICRRLTVSACLIEGVSPGENPGLSTMWAFPMSVQYGVPLPFWVAAGTTPPEVNGPETAPLCDEGLRLREMAQHQAGLTDTLDTYVLNDGVGGGVHSMTFPLEAEIVERTDSAMAVWRAAGVPDSIGMSGLTQQLATHAYDVISHWPQVGDLTLTPCPVNDLTLCRLVGSVMRLRWSAVTQNIWGWPQTPASGYSIWSMTNLSGPADSMGYTTQTQILLSTGIEASQRFYLVKAIR